MNFNKNIVLGILLCVLTAYFSIKLSNVIANNIFGLEKSPLSPIIISMIIGVIFSIVLVHLGFKFVGKFLASKFTEKQLIRTKTFFEYSLIVWVIYYLFY